MKCVYVPVREDLVTVSHSCGPLRGVGMPVMLARIVCTDKKKKRERSNGRVKDEDGQIVYGTVSHRKLKEWEKE
ncbi:hypothetical protein H5410_039274 [Solanum commersonii]|uniref:Uncharacterized protein n=1 Tax=Solanum commersonii TaxID=4109 RepID=A0A9J5YCW9_SOLCO|nr:hypothetical protein H5410_039274 [Solanum commersonii]